MKLRDSRFELLRIVSMFMIVISHFAIYGNWEKLSDITAIETTKILVLDSLGPIGAVIFFMITGYFHSTKDFEKNRSKSFSKAKQVWLKTWGYSIFMLAISIILKINVSMYTYVRAILPVIMNEYWFITCYIILVLFVPYIDIALKTLTKRQFTQLLLLFMCLMFVQLINSEIVNRLTLAIFAYTLGYYIKEYSKQVINGNTKVIMFVGIGAFLLDVLSIYVSRKIGISFSHSAHFTQYVLPIIIGGGILLFMSTEVSTFENRVINLYAASVLPIYLITESTVFRDYMWSKLLNVGQYQSSPFFYLIAVGITIIICFTCATFDVLLSKGWSVIKKRAKVRS